MKFRFLLFSIFLSTYLLAQDSNGWTYLSYDEFDGAFNRMKIDENGHFWLTRDSSLFRFNGTDWREYRVAGSQAVYFTLDLDNDIAWVINYFDMGRFSRLYQLNLSTGVWTPFNQPHTEIGFFMRGVERQHDGTTVLLSNYFSYKLENGAWEYYKLGIHGKFVRPWFFKIATDSKNDQWIISDSYTGLHGTYVPFGVYHINSSDTIVFEAKEIVSDTLAYFNHILIDENDIPHLAAGNQLLRYKDDQWETLYFSNQVDRFYDMRMGPKGAYLLEGDQITIVGDTTFSLKVDFSCRNIEVDEDGNIYAAGFKKIDDEWVAVFAKFTFGDFIATGTMYIDENENGQLDTLEPPLPFYFVTNPGENTTSITSRLGSYGFVHGAPKNSTVSTEGPKHFFPVEPVSRSHDYQLTNAALIAADLDFGFKPDLDAIDVSVSLAPLRQANPGFNTCYSVIAKNWAFTPNSGAIKCEFSDPLIYLSATPAPISLSGNDMTFQTQTLGFLEEERIKICFVIPPNGGLIGDTITAKATITSDKNNDWDLTNNVDRITQEIRGPYDPNIIEVYPAGIGANGDIPLASLDLDYTIHFQNVGNDTARQVIITNIIDPNLNLTSLEMQSASHEYKMEYVAESNMMKWIFPRINLVDSLTNEEESVGFLKYNIELQPDLPKGTQIKNDANIFFDFNDPIMTNTVVNTLAGVTSNVEEPDLETDCDLKFMERENDVLIKNLSGENSRLTLFDISGRLVLQKKTAANQEIIVPTNSLSNGTYFLVVKLESCPISYKHVFIKAAQ